MILWLIVCALMVCSIVVALVLMRALLGGIDTDCRVLPQNAATGLDLVRTGHFVDDGGAYIDGTAVRL